MTDRSYTADAEPGLFHVRYASGHESWVFRFHHDGRQRQRVLGPVRELSVEECRLAIRELKRTLDRGLSAVVRPPAGTVPDVAAALRLHDGSPTVELYSAAYLDSAAFKSTSWENQAHVRRAYEQFIWPGLGHLRLNELRFRHVREVLEPLAVDDKKATARMVYAALRRLFNDAVEDDHIGANPLSGSKKSLGWMHSKPRTRVLTLAEVRWVFDSYSPTDTAGCALRFMLLTGSRPGEALALRAEDVTSDHLTFRNTKNGKDRTLPVTPAVAQIVLPRRQLGTRFFDLTRNGLWWRLRRDMQRAGFESTGLHTLRATVATMAAEQRVCEGNDLRLVMGHKARDVHERHYQRGDMLPAKRRALESWEAFLREQGVLGSASVASAVQ